ncbi:hypothetical protein HTS61_18010 [Escherichia coli]|nr:hypothetical protein [Escherichia coli]
MKNKQHNKKLFTLKATLTSLKTPRNAAAHTFIKGTSMTIDAPSVTLANFIILFDGFKDFKDTMKTMKLL